MPELSGENLFSSKIFVSKILLSNGIQPVSLFLQNEPDRPNWAALFTPDLHARVA
jgi:hypothetical protein